MVIRITFHIRNFIDLSGFDAFEELTFDLSRVVTSCVSRIKLRIIPLFFDRTVCEQDKPINIFVCTLANFKRY